MKRTHFSFSAVALMLSTVLVGGCTNSDYDFNNIDLTMGFGTDSMSIPLSSSADLMLYDIFELQAEGSVRADESTGWDYVFHLAGGDVEPAHPKVDVIEASAEDTEVDYEVSLSDLSSSRSRARRIASSVATPFKPLAEYTYEGNISDVVSITKATADPVTFRLNISFPTAMRTFVPTIRKVTIAFPDYLTIDAVSDSRASVSRSVITLSNVSTAQSFNLDVRVSQMDFSNYDSNSGLLTINNGKVTLSGSINMGLDFDADLAAIHAAGYSTSLGSIEGTLSTSDLTLRTATGRFDPQISFETLGDVEVTGIPDFLADGNVVADLDNPQILLTIANDMDIAAHLNADVVATKNGSVSATIHLSNIYIDKSKTNRICICRHATDELEATYGAANVYAVSNISDLIRTIPDRIQVNNVSAHADLSQDASIEFGKTYTVQPSYEIDAPLAFGKDATIVYKYTTNGWGIDTENFTLKKNSYVVLTADVVNKLPLNLDLDVTPLDKDGKAMSASRIRVELPTTAIASADGETPSLTSIKAKVTELDEDALNDLDGVEFTITGAATKDGHSVTGVTLNAKKHTVRFERIKATVVGKVVGDFN